MCVCICVCACMCLVHRREKRKNTGTLLMRMGSPSRTVRRANWKAKKAISNRNQPNRKRRNGRLANARRRTRLRPLHPPSTQHQHRRKLARLPQRLAPNLEVTTRRKRNLFRRRTNRRTEMMDPGNLSNLCRPTRNRNQCRWQYQSQLHQLRSRRR